MSVSASAKTSEDEEEDDEAPEVDDDGLGDDLGVDEADEDSDERVGESDDGECVVDLFSKKLIRSRMPDLPFRGCCCDCDSLGMLDVSLLFLLLLLLYKRKCVSSFFVCVCRSDQVCMGIFIASVCVCVSILLCIVVCTVRFTLLPVSRAPTTTFSTLFYFRSQQQQQQQQKRKS